GKYQRNVVLPLIKSCRSITHIITTIIHDDDDLFVLIVMMISIHTHTSLNKISFSYYLVI
ncbi:MAG TPA: hypothetical protein VE445_07550, partial [Nitrososphaeraceae archaeon]|nr:hypothetical protein [Nitrososphaeraceae archaeon]